MEGIFSFRTEIELSILNREEYYYLQGKEKLGPFSLNELKIKSLTTETFVWYDGLENWQKLKDIPELYEALKPKKSPPPLPNIDDEIVSKTEVSGHLKVTKENTPNPAIETIKPSKTALTIFLIWAAFHLFALLTSYSGIDNFNERGNPRSDKF